MNKINTKTNTESLGTVCMLAASLCFSTGGLLMKLIPWNPLAINGARNVIAAIVIGLYILVTKHKLKFNPTVLVGAVSMAGVTTLYSIANKLTTAGNTIILQYTAPIWIVILMFLIFAQKPSRSALISILIVFAGILCFFFEAGRPDGRVGLGLLLMGGSALTFALSVCITRRVVARYGAGLLMGGSALVGSILVLPLAFWKYQPGELAACVTGWRELAFVILVGTVAGYFLYYASMKYISAYLASMTFLLKPIFACLMACCLAGEKMNAWTITGTVVIVCSLLVTSLPAHKRSNG